MANLLIWIILLAIWNSILFFKKELGISVILFIIPLVIFIYYTLKTNNKIKNKKGLLIIIPIILLSLTYLIFDNYFFKMTNVLAIPILFTLLYIYTMKPTFNIKNIISSIIKIIIEPLSHIGNIYHLITEQIKKKIKVSNKIKRITKSIIIIIPIVLIVLLLLSSADQIFSNIFNKVFSLTNKISLSNTIKRLIPMIILFFYLAATINYLLYNYSKTQVDEKKINVNIDSLTVKILLTTLNIIYIVFDIIQIKSLILHKVSMNISYAEYAREGFFQLMIVSFINLVIILVSKNIEKKQDERTKKYIKIMNLIMVFLTFIIIISSFIRMHMYETEFGYTLLRLLVYFSLIAEIILLIPTIIYIIYSKFSIVKHYIIILITMYTIINFINIDYVIAYRNIKRYYKTNNIDIYYLMNNHTDNIPLLIDLYNKTDDVNIKEDLNEYLNSIKTKTNCFQEFNVSKIIANKKLNS